jgi:hypothetical protein
LRVIMCEATHHARNHSSACISAICGCIENWVLDLASLTRLGVTDGFMPVASILDAACQSYRS